jgi:hypothetical protein
MNRNLLFLLPPIVPLLRSSEFAIPGSFQFKSPFHCAGNNILSQTNNLLQHREPSSHLLTPALKSWAITGSAFSTGLIQDPSFELIAGNRSLPTLDQSPYLPTSMPPNSCAERSRSIPISPSRMPLHPSIHRKFARSINQKRDQQNQHNH